MDIDDVYPSTIPCDATILSRAMLLSLDTDSKQGIKKSGKK